MLNSTPILAQARALGFDSAGVCAPDIPAAHRARMEEFVAEGAHGDMAWMQEKLPLRVDPKTLWPEVRSIVVVAHSYAPQENPLALLQPATQGVIAAYARHRDYHDVMKKRLRALAAWMVEAHGGDVKLFVDTAPVMEKSLAAAAGIGWVGKHTNVLSRTHGNWLFLGSVWTTLPLSCAAPRAVAGSIEDVTDPARAQSAPQDFCGTCTRCIDACPTQAITAPHRLDARRCIAYLTIEHKGQIPLEFRKAIGNRVYGCDDCLAVCPWNKFAETSREAAYHARDDLNAPPLSELLTLDDAAFRAKFAGSPVKRTGRDRFIRNVLVAAGNSGDASLLPQVRALKADASPLVAEMAAWAEGELGG